MRPLLLALWRRQSLIARMLVIASAALLLAGLSILFMSARQEAHDARTDLDVALANELESLPPILAEAVVIGDYASVQQSLDRYAARPLVASIEFVDASGKSLRSLARSSASAAPAWFFAGLGVHDVAGKTAVSIGGHDYGKLELTLTARGLADRAWHRMLDRAALLLLAVTLDFLVIWQLLIRGLEPLKRLEHGADAIANGALETRLVVTGSPELQHVITAFNRMAAATQNALGQLRQSNADLTRFAEVSAHHLMEPTRRLTSYTQQLRARISAPPEERNDEDIGKALDTLERDANRLRRLIRDIQLYLAASEPRGEIRLENANDALATAIQRLALRYADIATLLEVTPLPAALLDKPRLTDLFTVLIENALRHAHPADPSVPQRIHVSGERVGALSRYSIRDNGQGIPAQYHERIFEIFERLDSSAGGTGIGLSIARRIVESRHGKISIENLPHGGAMVVFDLPDGEMEQVPRHDY